jgi:hypothetical protein
LPVIELEGVESFEVSWPVEEEKETMVLQDSPRFVSFLLSLRALENHGMAMEHRCFRLQNLPAVLFVEWKKKESSDQETFEAQ